MSDRYRVINGKGEVIQATDGMAMPHVYRMEDVCPWLCPWLSQVPAKDDNAIIAETKAGQ